MTRIHEDRGLTLSADIPADLRFKGEQQDLEEMVGNLLDNACKWAKSKVSVSATSDRPPSENQEGRFTIRIDDDGPGLSAEQRAEATRRGRRLDETKPGFGLGLSIVTDLVGLYDGSFRLDRSPDGGLRAEIELPAV
jgi:signal transduction histidine kinase